MTDSLQQMQRAYWNGLSDRYQRSMKIALDDFHYGPQIPGESELQLLPELRLGMRALELGCGAAQNSIYLAKHGLCCSACDISKEQLKHARAIANTAGVEIDFACMPIEKATTKFKGPFDLIHSSHAFEFVDRPGEIIHKLAGLLAPGGTLLISTVHPLYNGEWVENFDEEGNPVGMGLFLDNYFSPPDDVRTKRGKVDVISRAYPISSWFRWFRAAGLEVTALEEPAALGADEQPPYTNKDWADTEGELQAIPGTLIILGRQRPTATNV